jgi:hypothetical protein
MNKSIKIFPCTCTGEGLVVQRDEFDERDSTIEISFWNLGQVNSNWSWWDKIKAAWCILRKGREVYNDMVILDDRVAKHLAHHILYLLDKKKLDQTKLLVKDITPEQEQEIAKNIKEGFQELAKQDKCLVPGFNTPSASDLRSEAAFKITANVKESGSSALLEIGDRDI